MDKIWGFSKIFWIFGIFCFFSLNKKCRALKVMWKKCQNFEIWTHSEGFRAKKLWNSKPNLGVHFGWNSRGFVALKPSKWTQISKFWHFFHITFNARHFLCYEKFQKNPKILIFFFENPKFCPCGILIFVDFSLLGVIGHVP